MKFPKEEILNGINKSLDMHKLPEFLAIILGAMARTLWNIMIILEEKDS